MKYLEPFYLFTKIHGLRLTKHTDELQKTGMVEIIKINDSDIKVDTPPHDIANIIFTELRNRGYGKFFGVIEAEKNIVTRQYLIAYHVMVKDLLFKQFKL